jgi:hypothetical protein
MDVVIKGSFGAGTNILTFKLIFEPVAFGYDVVVAEPQ